MEKFISYNPVKLYFGKGVIANLPCELKNRGKNILLIFGKGSILKNGIYNDILKQIDKTSFNVTEYSGIKSNPLVDDVYKMIRIARENNTEVILAVG
ncbi:MAG: iron-containing alcohol dehydrogenase, partial [Bacteroidota bacterium]